MKLTGFLAAVVLLQGGVSLSFDLFSVWNFLVTVVVFAAGGYLIFRANRAAYVKVLKETSEGWERAYKQKATDLEEAAAKHERQAKETAERHERQTKEAVERHATDITELKGRLERLQGQFDTQERNHRDAVHQLRNRNDAIVNLNLKLQVQLAQKDAKLEWMSGRVLILENELRRMGAHVPPPPPEPIVEATLEMIQKAARGEAEPE